MPYEGPGVYQHYKGPCYEVLGLAVHEHAKDNVRGFDPTDPERQFVVYRPLTPGGRLDGTDVCFWLRRRGDFDHYVFVDPQGESEDLVPRFAFQGATGG